LIFVGYLALYGLNYSRENSAIVGAVKICPSWRKIGPFWAFTVALVYCADLVLQSNSRLLWRIVATESDVLIMVQFLVVFSMLWSIFIMPVMAQNGTYTSNGSLYSREYAQRVAARCKGETAHFYDVCACTVKNRLIAGWNPAKVLNHYYAHDGITTNDEVDVVRDILNEKTYCDSRYYYLFGGGDVRNLRLTNVPPVAKYSSGHSEIWVYDRGLFKRGRSLSSVEIQLANTVFGSSIDYSGVRLIPNAIASFVAIGNDIYVPLDFTLGNINDNENFIHELVHVWQYQDSGVDVLSESVRLQVGSAIWFGNSKWAYNYEIGDYEFFFQYNVEQQAWIVQNYYAMRRDMQSARRSGIYRSNHLSRATGLIWVKWSERIVEIDNEFAWHEAMVREAFGGAYGNSKYPSWNVAWEHNRAIRINVE